MDRNTTIRRTVLMGFHFLSLSKHHSFQAEVINEFGELIITEITGLWVCSLVSVLQTPLPTPLLLWTADRECFALAVRKEFWERWLVCYVYSWCLCKGLVDAFRTAQAKFVHLS